LATSAGRCGGGARVGSWRALETGVLGVGAAGGGRGKAGRGWQEARQAAATSQAGGQAHAHARAHRRVARQCCCPGPAPANTQPQTQRLRTHNARTACRMPTRGGGQCPKDQGSTRVHWQDGSIGPPQTHLPNARRAAGAVATSMSASSRWRSLHCWAHHLARSVAATRQHRNTFTQPHTHTHLSLNNTTLPPLPPLPPSSPRAVHNAGALDAHRAARACGVVKAGKPCAEACGSAAAAPHVTGRVGWQRAAAAKLPRRAHRGDVHPV